jgi:uncharacterized RDD family membrane protein YckC
MVGRAGGSYRRVVTSLVRRPRRVALLALVLLAGCETHELTRTPDPPPTSATWNTVSVAVIVAGLAWTALLVRWIVSDRGISLFRGMLGTAYAAASVVGVGTIAWVLVLELRISSILGDQGCRSIPVEDRPRILVQLECSTDGFGGLFSLVFIVPPALLAIALTLHVLQSRSKPWLGTIVATYGAAGAVFAMFVENDEHDLRGQLGFAALAIAVSVAAAAGWTEIRRMSASEPAVAAEPAATPRGRPRLTAAAVVEEVGISHRLEARLVDILVLAPLIALVASAVDDPMAPVAGVLLAVAYEVGLTAWAGHTFGKRALGLQVVRRGTREPPALPDAIARMLGIALVPFVVIAYAPDAAGVIWVWLAALFLSTVTSEDGRGIHDLAARTEVVRQT